MPRLIWAVTCKTVITDRETNSLSYIEAIHGLTARRLPAKLPRVMLGTVWRATKATDDVLQMRLRVESPDGEQVVTMDVPKVAFEHPYQRLNIDLAGMDVPEAGEYAVIIESYSKARWREDARLPFTIRVEQPPTDEA